MSTAVFNQRWATLVLEALSRHQVRHVCIAPGSRSTPLTLAAAAQGNFICHTHFDERGLGHLALGLAKASGEPVAVIVTSGTAVANLYPAVIEARLTGERLVLLTADRPVELIHCGANQAIEQPGIFASHALQRLDLPRPTPEISARWLVSALDNAMNELAHGALHVNCPFAEPLYGEESGEYQWWLETLGEWWQDSRPWLRQPCLVHSEMQPDWLLWRQKRGVVVAGRMSADEGQQLAKWAAELGWPLIADVQSQTGQPLPCADLWLSHPQASQALAQAQLIIQFGCGLTGKRLLQWLAAATPEEYWLVDKLPGRQDPAQHRGRRIQQSVADWLSIHGAQPRRPWCAALEDLAQRTAQMVEESLAVGFGEAQLAYRVNELLPEHGLLFLGNSLVVRLVDAFAQLPVGYPVYANRGASGIDGLLATAAGVQRASCQPMLMMVGDISTLYDINSLMLLRQCSAPTVVVVVNNNGGQIFSLLPTPSEQRRSLYCMPQNVDFRHAAALFGMDYSCPQDWSQLSLAVNECWRQGGAKLVELRVDDTAGVNYMRQLLAQVGGL